MKTVVLVYLKTFEEREEVGFAVAVERLTDSQRTRQHRAKHLQYIRSFSHSINQQNFVERRITSGELLNIHSAQYRCVT